MDDALIVAGRFDDNGGKPSGFARRVFGEQQRFVNGGHWDDLVKLLDDIPQVVIWLADVPNDKPKLVNEIKKKNPHCLLVTSKRNDNNKYQPLDLIERMLRTRSALLLEFDTDDGVVRTSIWDPLGNVFAYQSRSVIQVARCLWSRIFELCQMRRINSVSICEKAIEAPDESEFFAIAREHAEKYHAMIHASNTERFVGNLSFRCGYGFPSFRTGELIFVSRRNIDKRAIDRRGFIAVDKKSWNPIQYYGFQKPSVDTPVLVRLYDHFCNIRYMLHSHVYIANAPTTRKTLPCGAIEEFLEICDAVGDCDANMFRVNLRGHGSIVGVRHLEDLSRVSYVPRPLPEYFVPMSDYLPKENPAARRLRELVS